MTDEQWDAEVVTGWFCPRCGAKRAFPPGWGRRPDGSFRTPATLVCRACDYFLTCPPDGPAADGDGPESPA